MNLRLSPKLKIWGGFVAFMALFGICPCCGRVGCPTGIGFYATLSAIGLASWNVIKETAQKMIGQFRRLF
jgi:hypothetical protein